MTKQIGDIIHDVYNFLKEYDSKLSLQVDDLDEKIYFYLPSTPVERDSFISNLLVKKITYLKFRYDQYNHFVVNYK